MMPQSRVPMNLRDVFTVSNTREDKGSRIDIEVGGVRISAIIDSGASVNIIE